MLAVCNIQIRSVDMSLAHKKFYPNVIAFAADISCL